jgi:aubergine-like protein
MYQYHVDFAPVVDSKKVRFMLMKPHDNMFQNKAFDGSTIYSLTKLPDEFTEVSSANEAGEIILIKIKRVAEVISTSPQFVQLFSVVFRKCLKKYGMQELNRNYFDMSTRIPIRDANTNFNLDLINGFATSISTYESKLLLCLELTHKILHKKTVYDKMTEINNQSRGNNFRETCVAEIVGKVVMTTYNDKTFMIDDIAWDDTPMCTFMRNEQEITFRQYYRQQYNIDIPDNVIGQPLLVSLPSARDKRAGRTEPHRLVPSLCVVTGVDEAMRSNFRFKAALDLHTKIGPEKRCERLSNFVEKFNGTESVKTELDKWQMEFSRRPFELLGRVLKLETLKFGNGKKEVNYKADWGNDMKGYKLLNSIKLTDWVIIYPVKFKSAYDKFERHYGDVIGGMGISADMPTILPIHDENPQKMIEALNSVIIPNKTQMVVVIVSSIRKDRYDAIKRVCCLTKPVPSQVITTKVLDDDRKSKSVVTKVAIQMNCKLGGEIWECDIPVKQLMICGIDTYHDSASKNSSVCAYIATSNVAQTRFFSRATIQQTHQELSNNLLLTVKSSLDYYFKSNGSYPEKIIVYRDGVGDGQLMAVKENEIAQFEAAFEKIDPNYTPRLCFIIVKKRGNARFFHKGAGRELENPPCGTIIDTGVTRAEWLDFYLISQHVTHGTVNPTHFNIIHDNINLSTDHYQRLTYKLTHMYYNWPGTIRVPAPCQYAHKLAFLVGQSLHKEHDRSLCNKLFFL